MKTAIKLKNLGLNIENANYKNHTVVNRSSNLLAL
jgi:hypothetical protein